MGGHHVVVVTISEIHKRKEGVEMKKLEQRKGRLMTRVLVFLAMNTVENIGFARIAFQTTFGQRTL